MPRERKEETTIESAKGLKLDPKLIKEPVPGTLDRADERATGRERTLGGEQTHHLCCEKG
jgi:hypothetical protein